VSGRSSAASTPAAVEDGKRLARALLDLGLLGGCGEPHGLCDELLLGDAEEVRAMGRTPGVA